ncbi:MAG: glycerol-3-phosphate acyltransferase [Phycisphaerae bacterium]|nr:MAG: glycerol-3-phosphate acyltransferase [Phycisphaerae bacterium]
MSFTALAILLCVGCYLVGGIPFGYLAGTTRGIDIRTKGSGNTGATNVGRVLGRKWAIAVFLLDALKGFLPTLAIGHWLPQQACTSGVSVTLIQVAWLGAGLCCVLGHSFPIYLRFKGGKGVATSLGVLLGIYPYLSLAGVLAFVVWGLALWVTRVVSLASIVAALSLPIFVTGCMFWHGYDVVVGHLPMIVFAILIAGLVLYRHRANIARLRTGSESRLGDRSNRAESP